METTIKPASEAHIRSNATQILSENMNYANAHLEDSAESLGLESTAYTLREFTESEAENDPDFFRWLFDYPFDDDFDSSLTDDQRNEYKKFLESI